MIRGSQTTLVAAGGGTVTELIGQVPSTIILVDHALTRTFYKGCIGQIVISGEPNAIFSAGEEGLADAAANEPEPVAGPELGANEVVIPAGAFDPANAANVFTPNPLTVAVGTSVSWRNDDSVFHTVTSGTSTGTVGSPDGTFDSGEILPGDTFSLTFDEPATFDYFCVPHPWMRGQIIVTG